MPDVEAESSDELNTNNTVKLACMCRGVVVKKITVKLLVHWLIKHVILKCNYYTNCYGACEVQYPLYYPACGNKEEIPMWLMITKFQLKTNLNNHLETVHAREQQYPKGRFSAHFVKTLSLSRILTELIRHGNHNHNIDLGMYS